MSNTSLQLEIGARAMKGLLGEFRAGNIGDRGVEKIGLGRHLGELSGRWDERFPGLLAEPFAHSSFTTIRSKAKISSVNPLGAIKNGAAKPQFSLIADHCSFKGLSRRGRQDEYLKGIIARLLEGNQGGMIVNPTCVWGRHARDLARRLGSFTIIGTDIQGAWDWLYGHIPCKRTPANYEFMRDDIFNPKVPGGPAAVVSFGACASLSDAAMDYAIESHCSLLVCRACCHTMIGGNTDIVKRPDFLNRVFRFQIFILAKRLARLREKGHYFSPKYSAEHYPRSETAKSLTNSDELIEVARNTVSSDICKSIIDLDRYLHLAEAGYDVWYRAEMFVAERALPVPTVGITVGPQAHSRKYPPSRQLYLRYI